MMLLSLYHSILVGVLSDWIGEDDLCALDTAVLNHSGRNEFLVMLSKCHVVNTNLYATYYDERFEWMLLRNVKLKKVRLTDRKALSSTLLQLLRNSCHLHYVETSNSFELQCVKECITSIKTVKVCSAGVSSALRVDLSSGPEIQHLDLSKNFGSDCQSSDELVKMLSNVDSVDPPTHLDESALEVLVPCLNCKTLRRVDLASLSQFNGIERWKYSCDLVLVDSASESTIELGSKHYEMKSFYCNNDGQDCHWNSLIKYLPTITSLTFMSIFAIKLWNGILASGCSLTSLTAHVNFNTVQMVVQLLQQSPCLQHCTISASLKSVDVILVVLAECCPKLESFRCGEPILDASLSRMFACCPLLSNVESRYLENGIFDVALLSHDVDHLILEQTSRRYVSIERDFGKRVLRILLSRSVHKDFVLRAFRELPQLLSVKLSGFQRFNFETIEEMVLICPQLIKVSIVNSGGFMCRSINLLSHCKNLTSLHLESLWWVWDLSITCFLNNKPNMVSLSLPDCPGWSGASLFLIARKCNALRHFDMRDNKAITSTDVIALLEGCMKLNYLNMQNCTGVTATVLPILAGRPMRYVNVFGCAMSMDEIEAFMKLGSLVCSCEFKYKMC